MNDLDVAKNYYNEIKIGLEVHKTLKYAVSADALSSTLKIINTPEALQFIETYSFQIVSLLLDQSPLKLGVFEKSKIEESLTLMIDIIICLLPKFPHLSPTLFKLIDLNAPFYAGFKTYYQQDGYQAIKSAIFMRFLKKQGFSVLMGLLFQPEVRWPGSGSMYCLMRAINHEEVLIWTSNDVLIEFLECVMSSMLNLSDDILKKDTCNELNLIIKIIGVILVWLQEHNKPLHLFHKFYQFWFDFIKKLASSGSLVLKLFAWDCLQELVKYVNDTSPNPKSYLVEDAGTVEVNGEYFFIETDKFGFPVYQKQPSKPNERVMSIKKFKMKDNTFRWFISIVTPGQNDIDFYEDHSKGGKLPSFNEWCCCNKNSTTQPPTFTAISYLSYFDLSNDNLLIKKFIKWVTESDILSFVFKTSIHREIVSRSESVLLFLAEHQAIKLDLLEMIWKCAIQNSDDDAVDEVLNILALICVKLRKDLFKIIIDFAVRDLSENYAVPKIAIFIEKFSRDNYKPLLLIERHQCGLLLLQLIWKIYCSINFDSLKNFSQVQELLSKCLKFKCGGQFVLSHIDESIAALNKIKLDSDKQQYSIDEVKVNQIIKNLLFLFNKQIDDSVIESLNNQKFSVGIINEISRFTAANRSMCDLEFYSNGLSSRLTILRRFYGIAPGIKINLDSITTLWDILSSNPVDLNEFLTFLMHGGQNQIEFHAFCDIETAIDIFKQFICHDRINWKDCNETSFNCFYVYYLKVTKDALLINKEVSNSLIQLGLSTLWRVTLTIKSETSTRLASEMLLNVYDELAIEDNDAYSKMLTAIFNYLISSQQLRSSDIEDTESVKCIERCVSILHEAVIKSKVDTEPSHIVRGLRSRISIRVHYKRVNTFYNQNTRHDMLNTIKGTEGSCEIEVHPMHTVQFLKRKIMEVAGFPEVSLLTIQLGKRILDSYDRLGYIGVIDGCELSAIYKNNSLGMMNKFNNNNSILGNTNVNFDTQETEPWLAAGVNVGQLISNDSDKFDILLSTCTQLVQSSSLSASSKLCSSLNDLRIQVQALGNPVSDRLLLTSKKLWEIIMLIPTKFEMWKQVFTDYVTSEQDQSTLNQVINEESIQWSLFTDVSTSNLAKLAYYLQIIDNTLQPAADCDNALSIENIEQFRQNFINRNGFKTIIKILISIPSGINFICKDILATALHITHFVLFYYEDPSNETKIHDVDVNVDVNFRKMSSTVKLIPNESMLMELIDSSTIVVEKLLQVASDAATYQETGIVQDSLSIITTLLQSSSKVAITLINNPQAKVLLETVLRGESKRVRELAADFAIQFGLTQPEIFSWLLSILDSLLPNDDRCTDIFRASLRLLVAPSGASTHTSTVENLSHELIVRNHDKLSELLSRKLLEYRNPPAAIAHSSPINSTTSKSSMGSLGNKSDINFESKLVLQGFLELLSELVKINVDAVLSTELGANLVPILLNDFLFTMPSDSLFSSSIAGLSQIPIGSVLSDSVCGDNLVSRQSAFKVLLSFLKVHTSQIPTVINYIDRLCLQALPFFKSNWELLLSLDIQKSHINFLGLKNQGCTCYSNSFLQQLFMNKNFRQAVMTTPLLEYHRTSVWHRDDEALVGRCVMVEFRNGSWTKAFIRDYDHDSKLHTLEYNLDNKTTKLQKLNIHNGRRDVETGKVRIIPADDECRFLAESFELTDYTDSKQSNVLEYLDSVSDRETAAYRVLEQLQRTFCHLEFSKKRYYDPKPLVEACKTLNMNFDVYHQNDAAEFCDQLLDRIETSTKGRLASNLNYDTWSNLFKKVLFGGEFLTQKIPRDCDAYQQDKRLCGHWQSSRKESFLKLELIIRNKESIDESLKELVQGELMDGDNKINCEVCTQKKATVRRTCLDTLPNTLIIHLKRFDLDFNTFETVKLNSKLEFPMKLNLLKYTKDGIEYEEKLANQSKLNGEADSSSSIASLHESSINNNFESSNGEGNSTINPSCSVDSECLIEVNPKDFEYELQGVLVHSGVAQGGHYYSFIKDPDSEDKWYRFDDDDVTPFNADQIPIQCYGGVINSISHTNSSHHDDIERTSNALMLFYNKIQHSQTEPVKESYNITDINSTESSNLLSTSGLMIDGYQAFKREVHESNQRHILSCYLLDSDLHGLIRDILNLISVDPSTSSISTSLAQLNISADLLQSSASLETTLQTFQFAVRYLLDIILHCRERSGTKAWLQVFQSHFDSYCISAKWFIKEILTIGNNWLFDYMINCPDVMSRSTFVNLLVSAVQVLAIDMNDEVLSTYQKLNKNQINELLIDIRQGKLQLGKLQLLSSELMLVALLQKVKECLSYVPSHIRTADEIFVLIRDLASIPSVRKLLNSSDMIVKLCYFIIPEAVNADVITFYAPSVPTTAGNINKLKIEYSMLYSGILEAIASLLGLPQVKKVNLLQDNRPHWERILTSEAKDALTTMYHEITTTPSVQVNINPTPSNMGLLTAQQVSNYLEKVFGAKQNANIVKQMMDFSTSNDGKLNLEGFLLYYADKSAFFTKDVWMALNCFGFRNDLTRNRSSDLSLPIISNSTSISSELCLTQYARVCLMNIGLYEAGIEHNEEVTKAIVQRVCFNEEKMSASLITMTTKQLFNDTVNNVWSNKLDSVFDFLLVLLKIDDNFTYSRVKDVLLNRQAGFITIIYNERQNPSNCRMNEYDKSRVLVSYIDYLQTLCKHQLLQKYIRTVVEEDPAARDVKGILKLKPDSLLSEDDEESLRQSSVTVQDAGVSEVNGQYIFTSILNDSGHYSKKCIFQGKQVTFHLYKCSMNNGQYNWYISITPENLVPGTTKDVDFYNAGGYRVPNDRFPPVRPWNAVNNNNNLFLGRAPIVQTFSLNQPSLPQAIGVNYATNIGSQPPIPPIQPGFANVGYENHANFNSTTSLPFSPGGVSYNAGIRSDISRSTVRRGNNTGLGSSNRITAIDDDDDESTFSDQDSNTQQPDNDDSLDDIPDGIELDLENDAESPGVVYSALDSVNNDRDRVFHNYNANVEEIDDDDD